MRSCVLRLYFLNSRIYGILEFGILVWNSILEFQNLDIFLGVRGFSFLYFLGILEFGILEFKEF